MSKTSIVNILGMFLIVTAAFFGPTLASAQPTQTLVQNQLESNVLIAPDFKLTDLGGDLTGLAGVYGGWLINQQLLIGGGGYFQTNDGDVSGMKYGGAVLEYFVNPSRMVNFSVRGLVGGGTATINRFGFGRFPNLGGFNGLRGLGDFDFDFSEINLGNIDRRFRGRLPGLDLPVGGIDLDDLLETDETFFVAEPEANVTLNVTEKFRIGVGAGYRFIGAANGFENRLAGFTGSLSAQFRF